MDSRNVRLADLEERVADACGVLNVAHAQLVAVTGELIESELWRGFGIRSVEHWLVLKAGLSPERARQVVEVASAAEALPVTTRKLADGELSFEQVHAVARHRGKVPRRGGSRVRRGGYRSAAAPHPCPAPPSPTPPTPRTPTALMATTGPTPTTPKALPPVLIAVRITVVRRPLSRRTRPQPQPAR
jgi:hypothetical protein